MSIKAKNVPVRAQGKALTPQAVVQVVDHSEFVDGGANVGTFALDVDIPKNAEYMHTHVLVPEGFAGNTSATLQVGDGSDMDRYNTGAPSVFADAEDGINMGAPSGQTFHTAAANPVLTITTATDWGLVTAGKLVVVTVFLPPAI